MPTYVMRKGELVDKQFAPPLVEVYGEAPFVISDCMSETRHMANGRYYTSKSEFRKATKAAGCIEVGNETATMNKPRPTVKLDRRKRREDIKKAIHQLRNKS